MAAFELKFVEIQSVDDPMWDFVESVFEEAFPFDERREFHVQRNLAANECRFHQCVVFDGQTPVGIISYWMLDGGNYFEHIATSKEARGGGLGAAIVKHLLATVSPTWFGEVELPEDEMSRRRIGFYERLGFVMYPELPYRQLPYGEGKKSIPMLITTVGDMKMDACRLEQLIEEMSRTVYKKEIPEK